MSEENGEKKEVLRTIVLLLVGFVVGFATHAYVSVTGTTDEVIEDNDTEEVVEDERNEVIDGVKVSEPLSAEAKATLLEPDHTFNAIPNNTASDDFSISVTDQASGNVVYVSQMELKTPAWVAVREDLDGKLGNILGAGWYPEGKTSGVVELLRGTESNTVYYVVIYQDNGDKEFSHITDTLVTDGGENILVTKFRTY